MLSGIRSQDVLGQLSLRSETPYFIAADTTNSFKAVIKKEDVG
jgi:hypothetical protein